MRWCGQGSPVGGISDVRALDTTDSNCIIHGHSGVGWEVLRCNSRSWRGGLDVSRLFANGQDEGFEPAHNPRQCCLVATDFEK